jgi:hypothetical protein
MKRPGQLENPVASGGWTFADAVEAGVHQARAGRGERQVWDAGGAFLRAGQSPAFDRRGGRARGAFEINEGARGAYRGRAQSAERAARLGVRRSLSRAGAGCSAAGREYTSVCFRELPQARARDFAVVLEGPFCVEHRWSAARADGVAIADWVDASKASFALVADRCVSPRRARPSSLLIAPPDARPWTDAKTRWVRPIRKPARVDSLPRAGRSTVRLRSKSM